MAVESCDGLRIEWGGPVLRITIDRSDAGSTLTGEMVATMISALKEAPEDPEIRVVALGSSGKDFCTGVDLRAANAKSDARPRIGHHHRRIDGGVNEMIRALSDVELPVVAGVRGWAAGAGLSLALFSDYIVASESAKFWAPFTPRGFTPDSGTTYLIPRLIGVARAKEMLLLGKPVGAAKAEAWGMINEAVPEAAFDQTFHEAVGMFAETATVAVGLAKSLIRRNLDQPLTQALYNESFAEEVALRSSDFKVGIAALMKRGDANFTGS
ncbi:enoyl-CoA hydratase-related protein [Nocardia sp. NPDC005366]|uniref:enoyl-CoA hydratase/isomerase family protein n=1 Tax=Nocardia sp. NPDC005366 TaxID=3156878 RepID=UPI0033B1F968